MKKYITKNWGPYAPAAYVANGFIGFRVPKNAFQFECGLLSGFTCKSPVQKVEADAVLPTPDILFEYKGTRVVPEILEQCYDFSSAELETRAEILCDSVPIQVRYTIFCCRTSPTLLMGELCFLGEAERELQIEVCFRHQETGADTVGEREDFAYSAQDHDGKCLLHANDDSSQAGIAFKMYTDSLVERTAPMTARTTVCVGTQETKVQMITSYVPSVMHGEPHHQAHRMIKLATWIGFESLRKQNQQAWDKLWQSRILIEGAGEQWQDAVDASYFYLMSTISAFSPKSAAPYGLSHPTAYEGHVFWDTESFMLIPPLFCEPHIAENMLDYRFARIDAAKANAQLNGYRGIQFPWQSGQGGYEVTVPQSGQAGGAGEQHVNLDVAMAFDGYVRVTGDVTFMKEKAWPILRGVAEWVESRLERTERGYEILHVTGIDEEADDVPNDSYTNILAGMILRTAAAYSEKLGYGKRQDWLKIADGLIIPERDGILLQYEGIQAEDRRRPLPLMSYFPYGYSNEKDQDTFAYYVEKGMWEDLNYPMLSGFLGIFPAWLGDREKALAFYEKANLTFFVEPFMACTENGISDPAERQQLSRYVATSFITARASLLAGLLMGLTKICPWKGDFDAPIETWLGEEIILPQGWNKIILSKVYLRGKAYRITAEHGARRAMLEELVD